MNWSTKFGLECQQHKDSNFAIIRLKFWKYTLHVLQLPESYLARLAFATISEDIRNIRARLEMGTLSISLHSCDGVDSYYGGRVDKLGRDFVRNAKAEYVRLTSQMNSYTYAHCIASLKFPSSQIHLQSLYHRWMRTFCSTYTNLDVKWNQLIKRYSYIMLQI